MKTTILTATFILLSLVSFGQRKVNTFKEGNTKLHNSGDTVFIYKANVLIIDSTAITMQDLRAMIAQVKAGKVPLYVSGDWIVDTWNFIRNAPNPGFTDQKMDNIKMPLIPWVQAIQAQQKPKQ